MKQEIIDKYPWLTFKIDLRSLPFQAWLKLGACMSKCEHISKVPLKPAVAKEMHQIYLAKGVKATTAIEGNTLTEKEVRLRIEKKLQLPPSKEYLGQEVDNILQLCNEISKKITEKEKIPITVDEICRYNKIILQKTPLPEHVVPGKFREYLVGVGSYKAPDHKYVPYLMDRFCELLNDDNFEADKETVISSNIIKAMAAHIYLAWIHPFGDGNGRVARILEFAILLSSGVPSPAAHLLSNHYNATRSEYYRQLDLASKQKNINDFIAYATQGFFDGLTEQLKYIFTQIIHLSWESYIYETFKEQNYHEVTEKRRRTLILELSTKMEPIPKEKLIDISSKTIEVYRNVAPKTLERDLIELKKLDLVTESGKGYTAKIEQILTFLPVAKRK